MSLSLPLWSRKEHESVLPTINPSQPEMHVNDNETLFAQGAASSFYSKLYSTP